MVGSDAGRPDATGTGADHEEIELKLRHISLPY
jgi:hypothetical protein